MKLYAFLLSFLFVVSVFSIPFIPSPNTAGEDIAYKSNVCIYKNGEEINCDSNLLYTTGRNIIRDQIGNAASTGAIQNISLCNATAGCAEPVAAASETFNTYTSCGLANAVGAYQLNGDGNWSITKTFTATCDDLEINSTRLLNDSGTNFAGNNFTLVTLQTDDTLAINWTLEIN